MKGIYKREEHPDPDTNDAKLKNVKYALRLILKLKNFLMVSTLGEQIFFSIYAFFIVHH